MRVYELNGLDTGDEERLMVSKIRTTRWGYIYLLLIRKRRRNEYGIFRKVQIARGEDAMQEGAVLIRLTNALVFKYSWLR